MKHIILFIVVLLGTYLSGQAQNNINCSLSATIDTVTNADPNIRKVFDCWANYMQSSPDSLFDNPYWNETDKKRYTSYDLLKSEGWLYPGLYAFKGIRNQVLSITNMGDQYVIRSMFYWPSEVVYVMAITNTIARQEESGEFRLYNWLHKHTRSWNSRQIGEIEYHYYPTYPFNQYEAEKANKFVSFLKNYFDVKVDKIIYYIAENCDEIMRLKGFDYVIGMGNSPMNLCGFFDGFNTIIYSNAKKGENYEHELSRLINKFYPEAHGLFINGLSDYFIEDDIKLGLPLQEHFKRMDDYLSKRKEINLSNLNTFYEMDNITSPSYLIGIMICQLTLEKGGLELLKKGMHYGSSDEQLYAFLERELGIKQKNINSLFRKMIHKYAQSGIKKISIEKVGNK